MSSDEESFVILGSSPNNSMPSKNPSLENPINKISISENVAFTELSQESSSTTVDPVLNVVTAGSLTNLINSAINRQGSKTSAEINNVNSNSGSSNSTSGSSNSTIRTNKSDSMQSNIPRESLAASFILGEIDSNVIKTNIYSQFPSLCTMEGSADNATKMRNFMAEYVELKDTLQKVNTTMKQFYAKTQQWKEDMQKSDEQNKLQMKQYQEEVAALRNENLDLKNSIESKVEETVLNNEFRRKEHLELAQYVSEKEAQIVNMSKQIEKLEHQQLASFEVIAKTEANNTEAALKSEYLATVEHQRVVKSFERKLSVLLAENLDLKDVQKQYIDEITCLKVNLVAAEELINQLRRDVNTLQESAFDKSKVFAEYDADRKRMNEEIAILRQQINIYTKDFEMERQSRQSLASEKDQLLADLRALQEKNHLLIAEEQKRVEKALSQKSTHSSKNTSTFSSLEQHNSATKVSAVNRCPLCAKVFDVKILQRHVNECLDKQ